MNSFDDYFICKHYSFFNYYSFGFQYLVLVSYEHCHKYPSWTHQYLKKVMFQLTPVLI